MSRNIESEIVTRDNFAEYLGARVTAHQLGSDGTPLQVSAPGPKGTVEAASTTGQVETNPTTQDSHFFVVPDQAPPRLFKFAETVVKRV